MLQTIVQLPRGLRRPFRLTLAAAALTFILLILYGYTIGHAQPITFEAAPKDTVVEEVEPPPPPPPPPTVNLVLATIAQDNIVWTSGLSSMIPNLTIIRYVADDQGARYHPPQNKGREAMMYHTYFYDFYDNLPDISILTHAEDQSWHAERMLSGSLQHSILRMDLQDVLRRGYVNLRVTWFNACPDWIDTTVDYERDGKLEEVWMRDAFVANFAPEGAPRESVEVPRYLNQPCCSQFAVTRDAIRSVPREEYGRYIQWLQQTGLPDTLSGRTWEHMWQYLFLKREVDCPLEWKTYCRTFSICFESGKEYETYINLEEELKQLGESISFVPGETLDLSQGPDVLTKMNTLTAEMNRLRDAALTRGHDQKFKDKWMNDLYNEEEPGNATAPLQAQATSS